VDSDLNDLLARAAGQRVARLATIGPDGRPHLVPIVFAFWNDNMVTAIDDKPKRTRRPTRVLNIERDPRVTVLVDHYEDDWNRLWWVRIDGTARILGESAEAAALLISKYPQYRNHRLDPVVLITPSAVTGWASS